MPVRPSYVSPDRFRGVPRATPKAADRVQRAAGVRIPSPDWNSVVRGALSAPLSAWCKALKLKCRAKKGRGSEVFLPSELATQPLEGKQHPLDRTAQDPYGRMNAWPSVNPGWRSPRPPFSQVDVGRPRSGFTVRTPTTYVRAMSFAGDERIAWCSRCRVGRLQQQLRDLEHRFPHAVEHRLPDCDGYRHRLPAPADGLGRHDQHHRRRHTAGNDSLGLRPGFVDGSVPHPS